MSSNDGNGKSAHRSISDYIGNIDKNSIVIDTLRRFFYQILGIYTPAMVLLLYFLINLGSYDDYLKSLPSFLKDIPNIEIMLFILLSVLLGEAINAFTSRITILCPIKLTIKEKLLFIIKGRTFPLWSKDAKWPIWLNETTTPVSFGTFDRYYLTAIEQDKRTLAGKIGWTAFYRNFVVVFSIMTVYQIIESINSSTNLPQIMHCITNPNIPSNTCDFSFISTLILAIIASLFYLGYRMQRKANRIIFWNAYRKNELRKHLEAERGDLTLLLGIKDEYKKEAAEYIAESWFHAVERAMRDMSSSLLSKAEIDYREKYRVTSQTIKPPFIIMNRRPYRVLDDNEEKKIITNKDEIRRILVRAYKGWHDGDYEVVVSQALRAIKKLNDLSDSKIFAFNPKSNFFIYDNSTYGIKIQYPSDWKKVEPKDPGNVVVKFLPPNPSENFREYLKITIDYMPVQDKIDRYLIDGLKKDVQGLKIEKTSKPEEIILAGYNRASQIKVEATVPVSIGSVNSRLQIDIIVVYMIKNDYLYQIRFFVESKKYSNYEKQIEQIRNSFEKEMGEEEWKEMKGHYLFADLLHTKKTYKQIEKDITKWGWSYKQSESTIDTENQNMTVKGKNQINGSNDSIKADYPDLATLLSDSADPFNCASDKVEDAIRELGEYRLRSNSLEERYLKQVKEIYSLFGGFKFDEAAHKAEILLNSLKKGKESALE